MNQRTLRAGLLVMVFCIIAGLSPFVLGEASSTEDQAVTDGDMRISIIVRPGDTLWAIARKYDTTVNALVQINGIRNPNTIRVGTRLTIPETKVELNRGVTVNRSKRPLITSRSRTNTIRSTDVGLNFSDSTENMETVLRSKLSRPVAGGVLTSGYGYRWGRMHRGVDWACPTGTPVFAAASGVVIFSGWRTGYGWMVELDHGGYRTRYAHNSKLLVRVGQVVVSGEQVSLTGATGRTTGPHLHFELILQGRHVDPLKYLANGGENMRDL